MKILLSTSLAPKKGKFALHKLTVMQPLGLGYLAAVLEAQGHHVEICDCLTSNFCLEEAVDYIARRNPEIIGISVLYIL